MRDFDRFAEFLQREAAGYNEPPETPGDAMWAGVEVRLARAGGRATEGSRPATAAGVVGAGLPGNRRSLVAPVDYNRPPPAPREEMWARIESAWALRRAAPVSRLRPAWLGQRGAAGWVAALAAAASLVLGIGLGRGTGPSQPGEPSAAPSVQPEDATTERETTEATVAAVSGEVTVPPAAGDQPFEAGAIAESEPEAIAASVLPLTGANVELEGVAVAEEAARTLVRFAEEAPLNRTAAFSNPPRARRDHETVRYLGRAETLLTAFRTDQRTPLTERDLASWGRELLIETRMRLDLPVSRPPEEKELLEDLELLLLQISRLGSGATDVEWQLARESMELKGALPRVRAATATDGL